MIAAPPPRARRSASPSRPFRSKWCARRVAENRLIYHIQPVVTLPQRRPQGYDLVPRLMLEDGDLADRADFMPRRGGDDVLRHIEGIGLVEAITISRRARTGGQPITLYIPLSRATLGDAAASEQLIVSLEANRAIAPGLIFAISEADWQSLTTGGARHCRCHGQKGRRLFPHQRQVAAGRRRRTGRAGRALAAHRRGALHRGSPKSSPTSMPPTSPTILPASRSTLLATGITSERQIIELLDDGITLVQGPHIAGARPGAARSVVEPGRPAGRNCAAPSS